MGLFQADFTIFTDASTQAGAPIWGIPRFPGTWSRSDRNLHIICLELRAVISVLHHWVTVLQGHQVMITMDNTSVVSYINKQEKTHSPSLLRLVVDLFMWLQSQDIVLRARHIPGCLTCKQTDNLLQIS